MSAKAAAKDSPALAALENHGAFIGRHIGPSPREQQAMLDAIGFASRSALMDAVVPPSIRLSADIPLPGRAAKRRRSLSCARSPRRTAC
jgi:glycine cleavage system pyridoxal-binding protein P